MEPRSVIIIGDSLFAEALSQMLRLSDRVSVVGCAPTPQAAVAMIAAYRPDAVIVAETDRAGATDYGQLLTDDLDLPIIRANLNVDSVQVITSHRIGLRPADLLTAIAELPKRR
jgi:DNA-binding NarL/FixJ family response regulator